jgi:hypothetical protein
MGWIKPKTISRYCPFKRILSYGGVWEELVEETISCYFSFRDCIGSCSILQGTKKRASLVSETPHLTKVY